MSSIIATRELCCAKKATWISTQSVSVTILTGRQRVKVCIQNTCTSVHTLGIQMKESASTHWKTSMDPMDTKMMVWERNVLSAMGILGVRFSLWACGINKTNKAFLCMFCKRWISCPHPLGVRPVQEEQRFHIVSILHQKTKKSTLDVSGPSSHTMYLISPTFRNYDKKHLRKSKCQMAQFVGYGPHPKIDHQDYYKSLYSSGIHKYLATSKEWPQRIRH